MLFLPAHSQLLLPHGRLRLHQPGRTWILPGVCGGEPVGLPDQPEPKKNPADQQGNRVLILDCESPWPAAQHYHRGGSGLLDRKAQGLKRRFARRNLPFSAGLVYINIFPIAVHRQR